MLARRFVEPLSKDRAGWDSPGSTTPSPPRRRGSCRDVARRVRHDRLPACPRRVRCNRRRERDGLAHPPLLRRRDRPLRRRSQLRHPRRRPVLGDLRHGPHPRRQGLLARGGGRRCVHLRGRGVLRVARSAQARRSSSGWPPPPTARATGSWRSTGACSPWGTPPSTGRWGPSTSPNRWWAWLRPPTARATGWSEATAGSSPSGTPPSPARWGARSSPRTSPAWRPPPTARATGWSEATAGSSPSGTPPSPARRAASPFPPRSRAWRPPPRQGLLDGGGRRERVHLR